MNKLGKGPLDDATYQNNKALGFVVSHMKIFSFQLENLFYQYDLDTQQTRTIQTIFREGHIRNIPVKFGQNPASSLGRDAL